MPHRRALRAESLVLAGLEVGLAELVELPAQVLLLALPTRPELLQVAFRRCRRNPRPVCRRNPGAQVDGAGICIEQLGLRLVVEQRVVLVLTVERDEAVAQLAQLAGRGGPAVDSRRAAL